MNKNILTRINTELVRRQTINPNYSLRAYAKYLGISVSILSRLLNAKMPMTLKLLERISIPLAISPEEFELYECEISDRKSGQSREYIIESNQRLLSMDEFNVIQDWYNFAILEMVRLDNFEPCKKWIAKKISITESDAELALDRLIRLGLLIKNEDGSLVKSSDVVSLLPTTLSTIAMRERQKQILNRSINTLDSVEFSKRDQSAITLCIDSELLPEIKMKIKKMRRTLANYITKNNKKRDQVYELSVSFFPWSE